MAPFDEAAIVTGERLQALAEVSVTTEKMRGYHTGLASAAPLCVFQGDFRRIVVNSPSQIAPLARARSIFVYTHLLDSFCADVLPFLRQPFVLITHNSDDCITEQHRPLLEDGRLVHWFAQNATLFHPQLTALPVGPANSQWRHGNLAELARAARRSGEKRKFVYMNFDVGTNPGIRPQVFALLRSREFITAVDRSGFENYLSQLGEFKFCISPPGNGPDCHRHWECLYLGVIPILQRSPWTAHFEHQLPMVTIEDWGQLSREFLEREYRRIHETNFDLALLGMDYWRERIRERQT